MESSNTPHHVAIYEGKRDDTHFISHAGEEPYNSFITPPPLEVLEVYIKVLFADAGDGAHFKLSI